MNANNEIVSWSIGYACNGLTVQKSFHPSSPSCPISDFGEFNCGVIGACVVGDNVWSLQGSFTDVIGTRVDGVVAISDSTEDPCCDKVLIFSATPSAGGGGGGGSDCTPGSSNLCLGNGRFKVEATYRSTSGAGTAGTVGMTPDTGYLWFFDKNNVEVVVKILNGCALNHHYWVFAAGLTNVKVDLRVTDTSTGTVKTYSNPQGRSFVAIQDTNALAVCP